MANYPINNGDDQSLLDAVNYVASGPSGLGQPNVGFNTSTNGYVTGNYRLPYNNNQLCLIYRAPIALGNSYWLDDYTWKHEFAVAQPSAPFAIGNNITVSGVTPSDYDGTYSRIGVVYCDQNYVIARSPTAYPNPGVVGTGGTVSLKTAYFEAPFPGNVTLSTDCNGIVSVVGPEDYVNLSAQISCQNALAISATIISPGNYASYKFSTQLNRYKAFNSGTAANPQYFYEFDTTVAEQPQIIPLTGGLGQILTLSIDASSGTKVDTIGSPWYVYLTSGQMTTSGAGVNEAIGVDLPESPAGAYVLYDPVTMTGNTDITIGLPGYYFQVGDTITIDGNLLNGTTGVNDLVLRVDSVTSIGSSLTIDPTAVFTTILDHPAPGLYWYILELAFIEPTPPWDDMLWYVDFIELGRRSLTAQVIKK